MRLLLFFLIFLQLFLPHSLRAENGSSHQTKELTTYSDSVKFSALINEFVDNGGVLFESSKNVYGYQQDKLFTPASILKIVTASASLGILGQEYRFTTSFFQDQNNNLYIQGGADPFLTSEEVLLIWDKLQKTKLNPYKQLFIDNTFFDLEYPKTDGAKGSDNPYDALNSALAVNFNTLPIRIRHNIVRSYEAQTPLLPIMKKYGKELSAGKHRIALSTKSSDTVAYAGQLFNSLAPQFVQPKNIIITAQKVPSHLKPLYTHISSKTLMENISSMMLYSNNFIANQIFLTLGAHEFGKPATWQKGQKAVENYLIKSLHIDPEHFSIVEGSGLSRKNKISPAAMMKLLKSFTSYAKLLPQNNNYFLKTGTLTGVYSYAGFWENDRELIPFAIILNQKKNTRKDLLQKISKIID